MTIGPPVGVPDGCEHHWIHHHIPGLAVYWLVVCSQCGNPNVEDINSQIRDLRRPCRAWFRRLREHAAVTSWRWAIRSAACRALTPAREDQP